MRGEKAETAQLQQVPTGSPPHARGKEINIRGFSLSQRITPACAGKRALIMAVVESLEDHPRMRGEKTKKIPI